MPCISMLHCRGLCSYSALFTEYGNQTLSSHFFIYRADGGREQEQPGQQARPTVLHTAKATLLSPPQRPCSPEDWQLFLRSHTEKRSLRVALHLAPPVWQPQLVCRLPAQRLCLPCPCPDISENLLTHLLQKLCPGKMSKTQSCQASEHTLFNPHVRAVTTHHSFVLQQKPTAPKPF